MNAETEEAKKAIDAVLDAHWSALKARDADGIIVLVTDDFLSCGSDSKEFWNRTEMHNALKQMLPSPDFNTDVNVFKREIRVARSCKSAIAFEQMFMKAVSPKIPVRTIYHFVKDKGSWLIDFTGTAFIPDNADIEKLNKALE